MRIKLKKIGLYALLLGVIFLPGSVKYYKLLRQKTINETRLQALIKENSRLAEENKKLKEDPLYIEKVARENLGLAKPGEFVVKFINKDTDKK